MKIPKHIKVSFGQMLCIQVCIEKYIILEFHYFSWCFANDVELVAASRNFFMSFLGDALDSTVEGEFEDLRGADLVLLSWPSTTLSSSFAALGSVSSFF
ncbi:hypothetical protein Ahy_A07g031237 isoform C [Arachis hypogaea]|uniref:Uncharacterized protein n=1 Tax=Arachis hypogaea TaxID=3818 RepID=A0A445C399_ARAHY|nr:hypothetical protein Ahy_A07g031237 isoform C [Arachis hypogaea]